MDFYRREQARVRAETFKTSMESELLLMNQTDNIDSQKDYSCSSSRPGTNGDLILGILFLGVPIVFAIVAALVNR